MLLKRQEKYAFEIMSSYGCMYNIDSIVKLQFNWRKNTNTKLKGYLKNVFCLARIPFSLLTFYN